MGRKGLWRHILWAEFLVHLGAAAPEMDGVFLKVCPGALRVVRVEGALTAVPRCDGIRPAGRCARTVPLPAPGSGPLTLWSHGPVLSSF